MPSANQCDVGFLFSIHLCICITLVTFANAGVSAITLRPPYIRELKVPATIVNGSETNVVLDCDFRLDQNETALLVVNWYLNHSDLVYQWIFGQPPQSVGKLEERVNLQYEASDVDFEKHRAVQISNPTSDLSGEYSCKVSTKTGDAYKTAKMTVYSPATEFELRVSPVGLDPLNDLDDDDSDDSASASNETGTDADTDDRDQDSDMLNVTCWAYDVYPKPTVTLFYGANDTNGQPITDAVVEVSSTDNGAFDTIVNKLIDKKSLSPATLFSCELKIVDTHYYERREVYWKQEPSSGQKLQHTIGLIIAVSALLHWKGLQMLSETPQL